MYIHRLVFRIVPATCIIMQIYSYPDYYRTGYWSPNNSGSVTWRPSDNPNPQTAPLPPAYLEGMEKFRIRYYTFYSKRFNVWNAHIVGVIGLYTLRCIINDNLKFEP